MKHNTLDNLILLFCLILVSEISIFFKSIDGTNLFRYFVILFLPKDEKYASISDMLMSNNLEKALKNINKAIKINPKPAYFIRKATIFTMCYRYKKAINILEAVIKNNPEYTYVYGELSDLYEKINDYKKALEYANLDLLNNKHNPDMYYRKFDILFEMKRYDDCLNILDKIENEFSTGDKHEYKRAQIFISNKDYEKAILYLNKLLLREKNDLYLQDKMFCLFMLGRYNEAIDICLQIMAEKEKGIVCFWLSRSYLAIEDYQKALIYMNKSILLGDCDKWNYYWKSVILENLGRNDEAEIAYQKAVKLGYNDN